MRALADHVWALCALRARPSVRSAGVVSGVWPGFGSRAPLHASNGAGETGACVSQCAVGTRRGTSTTTPRAAAPVESAHVPELHGVRCLD